MRTLTMRELMYAPVGGLADLPSIDSDADPLRVPNEPFSPGGPLDWRGSARWCGKDWVGWGWCARGPVRDSVF